MLVIYKKLNGLSLFSGIGGIDVALSKHVRTVTYCEIDKYCQSDCFLECQQVILIMRQFGIILKLRLRALGNSGVPAQMQEAFEILMGLKK